MKKRKLKNIIGIALIALLFLGITVLAILISSGNNIPDGKQTGVIRITTDPTNINFTAYINGNVAIVNDKRINNLEKGSYALKISTPGFSEWEKKVQVIPGIVTEVVVKLFPTSFSLEQITNTNIDKIFFSQNGDYAFYVVANSDFGNEKGVYRIKLSNNQITILNNDNAPKKFSNISKNLSTAIAESSYEIIPNIDSSKVIFTDLKTNLHYILDVNSSNENPISLEDTINSDINGIHWFNNGNSFIIQSHNTLFEYQIANKLKILITSVAENSIPIYTTNNSLVYFFVNKTSAISTYKNQAINPLKVNNIELPKDVSALYIGADSDRFLVIKTVADYKFLDTERSQIKSMLASEKNTLINFANNGRNALFTNSEDNLLYIFNVNEVIALNTIEMKLIKTDLLAKDTKFNYSAQSTNILYFLSDIKPTAEGILKDQIKSMDKEGGNQISLVSNVQGLIKPFFAFDSQGEYLYFLLKDQNISAPNVTLAVPQNSDSSKINLYRINLKNPAK